jgi:hypothetical protein
MAPCGFMHRVVPGLKRLIVTVDLFERSKLVITDLGESYCFTCEEVVMEKKTEKEKEPVIESLHEVNSIRPVREKQKEQDENRKKA